MAGGGSPRRRVELRGRRGECEAIDGLLEEVRAGQSGVLVMSGEPGVGKTALLEYAIESAAGLRVARAAGVESERELAFAALHQLCAPFLDRVERLPDPQRDALRTVFGISAGASPDRFLTSLAVLGLLSEVAEERPLFCLVDDAQWLDQESARAVAFVARRLLAESVAMVLATREPSVEFAGLPELMLQGLRDSDARELLLSAVQGPLDEDVCERLVAETQGNPLALLELPRGLTPAELAGGFGLPDEMPLSGQIEESFQQRLEALPEETQSLLLVAALEPIGDSGLVWRAADQLGIDVKAAEPAESERLLAFGELVRFRHPLVRSAVYRAATPNERQEAYRALAEATDPELDPDRRAWHRAQAAAGPDEDVAAELERSAGRAQARGGLAAAAAFLERAVGLTLDPALRAQRALAAAQAGHLAGAPDAATELLATARAGPLDELGRARVDLLGAQMVSASTRRGHAAPLLLATAKLLEPLDVGLARETYMEALNAALIDGRLAPDGRLLEVAEAARAAPRALRPRAFDLLLDAFASRFTEGYAAAVPMLRSALAAFAAEDVSREEELRFAYLAAVELWDDETWEELATRWVQLARATGALTVLPGILTSRVLAHTFAGELAAAESLIGEVQAASEATGIHLAPYGALFLASWRGRDVEAVEVIEATTDDVIARGEGVGLTISEWASAVLYNGLGRYEEALAAAERAGEQPVAVGFTSWALVERIVAAVRSGNSERAADVLAQLSELTRPSGTDWALGIEARSRALLSEGDAADSLYREAIERFGRTRMRVELARAHLHYGEWLRRERRRLDAREHLRTAHEMFTAMDIEAFGEQAGRELQATGERVRKRRVETRGDLTAQETQIARLARDGLSNPEIGARLFISPRTVEYHLHKVFSKLGITSRNQLDRVLPPEPIAAVRS
jgi:DNA-binding CsgD family transcriptional regulator